MVRQFLKKKSKRMTCRKKYKIERKVREHKRKVRKEARKSGNKNKAKKDPGIPNKFPFKEQVLKEAELRKIKEEEMKLHQKEARKKAVDKNRNLTDLVKDVEKRSKAYNDKQQSAKDAPESAASNNTDGSLKAYYREFRKVVEAADVILEVLDARDPLGSRCPQVESHILASGADKKLVLVLNKIDLVPRDNVEKWLRYLRNEFPTVPFKASTQSQGEHLSQVRVRSVRAMNADLLQSKHSLGANLLMKLIGNYCGGGGAAKSDGIGGKASITVGVIGFPNVGKSSIINSLKRSRACNVGSIPGITKSMQEIHIDKRIKLLDSPGIIMADIKRNPAEAALKNCVRISDLQDPERAVDAILKRCPPEKLVLKYNLPSLFSGTDELLALLARRFGRVKKGGVPDVGKAARMLLADWTSGKISYYTSPPAEYKPSTHISASIVSELGKEFTISAEMETEEGRIMQDLQPAQSSSDIILTAQGFTSGVMGDEEEMRSEKDGDDEMESDKDGDSEVESDKDGDREVESDKGGDSEVESDSNKMESDGEDDSTTPKLVVGHADATNKDKAKRDEATTVKERGKPMLGEADPGSNLQLGKLAKLAYKRKQKSGKKTGKLADALADNIMANMNVDDFEDERSADGDEYDFDTDFKL